MNDTGKPLIVWPGVQPGTPSGHTQAAAPEASFAGLRCGSLIVTPLPSRCGARGNTPYPIADMHTTSASTATGTRQVITRGLSASDATGFRPGGSAGASGLSRPRRGAA